MPPVDLLEDRGALPLSRFPRPLILDADATVSQALDVAHRMARRGVAGRIELNVADVPATAVERADEVALDDVATAVSGVQAFAVLLEVEVGLGADLSGRGVIDADEGATVEGDIGWHERGDFGEHENNFGSIRPSCHSNYIERDARRSRRG